MSNIRPMVSGKREMGKKFMKIKWKIMKTFNYVNTDFESWDVLVLNIELNKWTSLMYKRNGLKKF